MSTAEKKPAISSSEGETVTLSPYQVPPTYESLNFQLPAGQRRCFYENIEKDGLQRNVVVFVQEGGDMEVILSTHGPLSLADIDNEAFEDPIRVDQVNPRKEKESDSQTYLAEFQAPETGLYAFCLDNRKARFFPKLVQIDIRPPVKNTVRLDFPSTATNSKKDETEEIKQTLKALSKIHKGIVNIQLQQQRDRHRLALHSATNQLNYDSVFYGSLIETVIFILVAMFQILFVRRWFASKVSKPKTRS